jgi:hypothetical protein
MGRLNRHARADAGISPRAAADLGSAAYFAEIGRFCVPVGIGQSQILGRLGRRGLHRSFECTAIFPRHAFRSTLSARDATVSTRGKLRKILFAKFFS